MEHVLALDGKEKERGAVFVAMIPELELAALELEAGGVEAVEEVEQGAAVFGEAGGGGGGLGHGQERERSRVFIRRGERSKAVVVDLFFFGISEFCFGILQPQMNADERRWGMNADGG